MGIKSNRKTLSWKLEQLLHSCVQIHHFLFIYQRRAELTLTHVKVHHLEALMVEQSLQSIHVEHRFGIFRVTVGELQWWPCLVRATPAHTSMASQWPTIPISSRTCWGGFLHPLCPPYPSVDTAHLHQPVSMTLNSLRSPAQ